MSLYYTNIILVIFYFLYIDKFWFYSLNNLPHKDIFRHITNAQLYHDPYIALTSKMGLCFCFPRNSCNSICVK